MEFEPVHHVFGHIRQLKFFLVGLVEFNNVDIFVPITVVVAAMPSAKNLHRGDRAGWSRGSGGRFPSGNQANRAESQQHNHGASQKNTNQLFRHFVLLR